MSKKTKCPHCGEMNIAGSNICGGCLRNISEVARREREDHIETVWQKPPPRPNLLNRIKRWWRRQHL
ncbi:MAG: hypothetical protein JRJ87_13530 [Deltaproteobacteria bacterium]|nr:hypothetical protein [Deltaproteobacteria bacterium]